MIIWGSKAKVTQIASGTFFCPSCKSDAPYEHMRVSRYFTLYFIPLFATSTLGEYVRCGSCRGELSDAVLRFTREELLLATQPWACGKCGNRNPVSSGNCLSCGAPKAVVPPPLPGAPAALPPPLPPPAER